MFPSSRFWRGLLPRLVVELIGEMRLHRRPFTGDDAVNHGVAQRSVWRDLVAAQNTVLLGAEALNAAPALVIEEVRAELYRNAIQLLEGVRQQQQFALCIERAALHAPGVPGRADLDATVGGVDIHVGGHARDLAVGVIYRERQHRAGRE